MRSDSPRRQARLRSEWEGAMAWHRSGCEIKDSGIPVPSCTRFFEPFRKGSGQLSPEKRGVGRRLAIVRSVVESHGGVVEIESEVGGNFFYPKGMVRIMVPARRGEPPRIMQGQ